MLPSKNGQVGARLGVCVNLATEEFALRRNFTNVEFNDEFSCFLNGPHWQRACECDREESEEGEESDDEGRALHVERLESNEGVRKVMSSEAAED